MAEVEDNDEIFVYMGGEQVVPRDVRRVRIHRSVKIIPRLAFSSRESLIYVEFHDAIERIERDAFSNCICLRQIKLLGVKVIEERAFSMCRNLTDVEFGVKLEIIERRAFSLCYALRSVTMPFVRTIGEGVFADCLQLTDLDLPEDLETIRMFAFRHCSSLERIAMPLIDNMRFEYGVFDCCTKLSTVALVGGIHKTIASLHLESWRNEMREKIRFPSCPHWSTIEMERFDIYNWISSVQRLLKHYKSEHHALLKEATTLLELALWKAKIDEEEEGSLGEMKAKAKIDIQRERREHRITSGASIVIKNVLPFLQLEKTYTTLRSCHETF